MYQKVPEGKAVRPFFARVALLRRMWPVYEDGIQRHFAAFLGRSGPRVRAMFERMADSAR